MPLSAEVIQYIQENIGTMSNEDLVDAARLIMGRVEEAAQHEAYGHASVATPHEMMERLQSSVASPWIGPDGQLIDSETGIRYDWEDL